MRAVVESHHLSLSLLKTCRSVYNEAALIPFAANFFIVRDGEHLQRLRDRLMPVQQRAIRHLEFISTRRSMALNFHQINFSNFTNLRHLRVRVDVDMRAHLGDIRAFFPTWSRFLKNFSRVTVERVEVIAYGPGDPVNLRAAREWAVQEAQVLLIESEKKDPVKADEEYRKKRVETRSRRGSRALKD